MAKGSQMETLDIQLHLSNIHWEDGYSPCILETINAFPKIK